MAENRGPLNGNGVPAVLVNLVLAVFVFGWLVSLGAEVVRADYTSPTGLNETMIALVTAFFVAQQRLGGKSDDRKDDDSPGQGRSRRNNEPDEDTTPTPPVGDVGGDTGGDE